MKSGTLSTTWANAIDVGNNKFHGFLSVQIRNVSDSINKAQKSGTLPV